MNSIIKKMNFKKIIVFYIVCLLFALIGVGIFLGTKYKDKLKFMYNYHSISEEFEHNGYDDNLKTKINNMSKDSQDIIDILVLDKSNKIIYSSKKSEYSNFDTFTLEKTSEKEKLYFMNLNNEKVVFKLVKDKELMINTIFSDLDFEIENEYKDDVFFETEFNQKNIYLLSYSANKMNGEKIYFINQIHPIENADIYFKFAASLFAFFFMIYWVLVALIVYQNALKSRINPYLWGIVTLFINLAGVILYLLYKQTGINCKKCNAFQDKNNVYCTICGTKINEVCEKCKHIIKKEDMHCANCGRKL